jgi:acyl-CoA synthetase (AMP-forming)/AMP-acid ligase II
MAEATLMVSFAEPLRAVRAVDVDRDALSYGDRIRLDSGLAEQRRTVVSCGAPVDAVGVRIWAGPDSAPEEDVIGEIQISGPSVTSGYLNLAAEEQPLTPDGWLSTGDLGFLHEGELYVTGRLKDMIILRGQNYYAEDVEQVVRSTPGVHNRRAAAFAADTGAGDPGDGERMVVLWETRLDAAAAAQLADDIRRRLADQLNLHRVEIHPVQVSAIPCTSSGKVKRHAARNRWRNDNLGRVHSAAGRQGAEQ